MNWDMVAGTWKQVKGKAQETWGNITDDDWDRIAGKRDQMVGFVQAKLGKTKEEAEAAVDEWSAKL